MNTLKKIITLTLIIGLIFNSYAPILVSASELKEFLNTEIVAMDNIDSKGKIEVDTHLVLPMINGNNINIIFRLRENDQEVSINLNNINKTADGIYMNNYTLGDQNIRIVATKRDKDGHILSGIDYKNNIVYLNINIYDLKQGDYQITLEGKNYQTFTQNITLDNYSKRVTLTNEKGMFTIGDLNNDNIVDQKDEALLLQAIEEQNIEYDLNLDGILDIADLNYLTAVIKGLAKEAKIEDIDAIINSKNIKFELTDTILEENNNLSNLFTDEEVVSLKTKDDSTINKDNPLKLAIDLNNLKMSEIRLLGGEDSPMTMEFIIETASGEVIRKSATNKSTQEVHYFTDEAPAGTIVIDLGKEIAVKKVAIVITETKTNKLADIAKIEFLNNVKVETKMPDNFYTPKITNIDTSVSEQLTVSFANVPNITGYEVKVIGPKMENGVIFATTYNNFTIEDLKNYATYKIYVQAVNQEWRSGWSEPVEASPEAKRIPPVVDMVSATANYSGIDFSWKAMDDTKTYNLYYREVGTEDWLSIKEIKENKYSLKGLKAGVSYEAYLTGVNDLGEGNKSEIVRTKTKKAEATITPKYKLINDYNEITKRTNHIKNVIYSDGTMVNGDNYAMVDDNYLSYWELNNWQASSHYYSIGNPIIILDDVYMMDEFVITVPDSYPYIYKNGTYNQEADNKNDVLVHYWNGEEKKNEKNKNTVQGVLNTKKDENGRTYYVLKLDSPIMADSIQLGLTVVNNNNLINIAEIKFYEYDSLVNDVAKLFVDDLRVELQSDVTKETIANLRKRADIKDNGEYNPYRDSIIKDLDYAEKILNDEDLDDVITLNPHISNYYNNHLGFAMTISDYQPLGVVVRPKETLTVYVGSKGNVNAEIIYTQYHAEADNWNKVGSQKLVKGQNIINIDQIGSGTSERGGSVYIRFTSMPDVNNPIKIRVSGGTKIPVIDTTNLTNENSKKEKIKNYIENLHEYNASLESLYAQDNKVFDSKNSVLASTEIITRHGLFSVSSIAVDDALSTGTNGIDEEVNRLYESLEAFDEMMLLFYRQKGLKENAIDNKDELPKARINIRYMRMFDGAFMYAGGYHIGIEYGSIAGLIQAKRNTNWLFWLGNKS